MAPFIRLAEDGSGNRRVDDGAFGLLPGFAKELVYGKKTYNAKSETIAKLPSFRSAWRMGQRCVIPAEAIFEPYYETDEDCLCRDHAALRDPCRGNLRAVLRDG